MIEGDIDCLTAREVLAYLGDELPATRRAEMDRHLDGCRLCTDAVEGVAGLEWREGYLRSAESLQTRVRSRTAQAVAATQRPRRTTPRFLPMPQYLALAAALVLAAGGAVLMTRPGPGEALFREHFEPYPSIRPVERGRADANSSALRLYEERDYERALAAFAEGLARVSDDSAALLYTGISRLSLGETRDAIRDLEQVLALGNEELKVPAEWYLALAHLRAAGTRGQGFSVPRARLERIAAGGGFYRDKARTLLSEIERLEPTR